MAVLFFLLGFLLFGGSDSFAQTYKFVDKSGTVCFTDNPQTLVSKEGASREVPKTKSVVLHKERERAEIKDIFQLGQEMLEKELAKPPEKQNRQLIKELGENLYGDRSAQKQNKEPVTSKR